MKKMTFSLIDIIDSARVIDGYLRHATIHKLEINRVIRDGLPVYDMVMTYEENPDENIDEQ